MINKGFYQYLELVAQDKNLDIEDVKNVATTAMIKACQLEGNKGEISV